MLSILTIIIIIVDQKSGLLFLPSLNTLPDVTYKRFEKLSKQISASCYSVSKLQRNRTSNLWKQSKVLLWDLWSPNVSNERLCGNKREKRKHCKHAVTWESIHDGGRSGDKPFRTQIGPGIPPPKYAKSALGLPLKHNEERIQQWKTNIWVWR